MTAFHLVEALMKKGVRVFAIDEHHIRILTHLDISEEDIQTVFNHIESLIQT